MIQEKYKKVVSRLRYLPDSSPKQISSHLIVNDRQIERLTSFGSRKYTSVPFEELVPLPECDEFDPYPNHPMRPAPTNPRNTLIHAQIKNSDLDSL